MGDPRTYRGNGLVIRSDIPLEEFTEIEPTPPDAIVAVGETASAALANAEPQTWEYGGFQRSPDGPVFTVDHVGQFLVTGGRRIDVSPAPGHELGQLRLYLMGSALGMLHHQRGQLVMHGAAVLQPHGVTLFAGPSGAGKSTLAAHLGARGHAILADDTVPLSATSTGTYTAAPGSLLFKLWRDSIDNLPTEAEHAPISSRDRKFYVRNPAIAPDTPVPLAEIILLDRGTGDPQITPIAGLEAVALISANTYRPEFLRLIDGGPERHFRQAADLGQRVGTFRLRRPWDPARMDETIDLLEEHWRVHTPQAGPCFA